MKCSVILTPVEKLTLEEMSIHHHCPLVRIRANTILLVAAGVSTLAISTQLVISRPSPYNWVKAWKKDGISGLLQKHGGGKRKRLPPAILKMAVQLAKEEHLTLVQIAQRLQEIFKEPLPCSLQTLRRELALEGILFRKKIGSYMKNEPF
ncbi:transposase [Comamonas odontotermitis]|uniref:helix-turn-helix domain-containing protein n=1 Tax=Comamonas odontotermitis TaxID=379895 RepID=UPI00366D2F48